MSYSWSYFSAVYTLDWLVKLVLSNIILTWAVTFYWNPYPNTSILFIFYMNALVLYLLLVFFKDHRSICHLISWFLCNAACLLYFVCNFTTKGYHLLWWLILIWEKHVFVIMYIFSQILFKLGSSIGIFQVWCWQNFNWKWCCLCCWSLFTNWCMSLFCFLYNVQLFRHYLVLSLYQVKTGKSSLEQISRVYGNQVSLFTSTTSVIFPIDVLPSINWKIVSDIVILASFYYMW
jgi:hypothetical protein